MEMEWTGTFYPLVITIYSELILELISTVPF